jgi:murein L,D-transpeptidase YafK
MAKLAAWAVAAWLAVPLPAAAVPPKALVPVPAQTQALMAAKDMDPRAPILIRAFKKESELEVWKMNRAGRYVHLKTFPICRWSGQLGPKRKTGDRQTPEGFYSIPASKMNPNSSYHLSFDLGYPNAYDRAHGGTGSFLMTHGTCSSMGCYAMTDAQISEIYALARDALESGQTAFQFQAFPFRMTAANMARARTEPHIDFWRQLKEGSDRFEATGEEPAVTVVGGRYTFPAYRNGAREMAARVRLMEEKAKFEKLVEDGAGAVRTTYADGGMHASFASLLKRGNSAGMGMISRPEALPLAGREVVTIAARVKTPPATVVAAAKPAQGEARTASTVLAVPLGTSSGGVQTLFARAAYHESGAKGATTAMRGSVAILPAGLQPKPVDKLAMRGA